MLRALRTRLRPWEDVVWGLALVGLLVWRWPVLKGYYYKLADVAAPASPIAWRTNLDAALAEAKQSGKPVLVDFSAVWCPPCLAMKHDTWTDGEVARAVSASTIPVLIDIDADPATASRFGIEAIPAVLMLDGNGRVLRTEGFLPASGVIRFLAGN